MKINLREVVIAILIFVVVFAVVQISIGSYQVEMSSMYPTFYGGGVSPSGERLAKDCVMVDKLTYRFRGPHRGEVVIIWPTVKEATNPYIKRVIGLPGETVNIEDGQVYIKKKGSDEFLKLREDLPGVTETPKCRNDGTWSVPKGKYFVLGDNRDDSSDSSAWPDPFVPRKSFIGKTWLRYWPLSRFGLTPHYSYKLESPTVSTSTTSITLPAIDLANLSVSTT